MICYEIQADPVCTDYVTCDQICSYTATFRDCDPSVPYNMFRFARTKDCVPPEEGDWYDDNDSEFIVAWDDTEIGYRCIWAHVYREYPSCAECYSQPLSVLRINTIGTPPAPDGPTDVFTCETEVAYYAGTVDYCGAGQTLTRYWGISNVPVPPTLWTEFQGTSFTVNWSYYEQMRYTESLSSFTAVSQRIHSQPPIRGLFLWPETHAPQLPTTHPA